LLPRLHRLRVPEVRAGEKSRFVGATDIAAEGDKRGEQVGDAAMLVLARTARN
jgi:hypothetical protein